MGSGKAKKNNKSSGQLHQVVVSFHVIPLLHELGSFLELLALAFGEFVPGNRNVTRPRAELAEPCPGKEKDGCLRKVL